MCSISWRTLLHEPRRIALQRLFEYNTNSQLTQVNVQRSSQNPIGGEAKFVSQTISTTMVPGQVYSVTVQLRNTGSNTCSTGVYKLGSQAPQDNSNWGAGLDNSQRVGYTYDDESRVIMVTNGIGHATQMTYDALGRVSSAIDANQGVTRYEYDNADRVIKVTDPRNLSTTFAYDGFGSLWKMVSPDTGVNTFEYDAAGRRTYWSRGQRFYAYDDLGRVTQVRASAESQTQNFTYDACTHGLGRVCTMTDRSGTSIYTYTREGQLASQRTGYGWK